MGLFSSKKKHYVDTQVTRVIPDEMIPNAIHTALAKALFHGTDIVDSLQDAALNGPHRKFERFYNYADSGEYYYGLPAAIIQSNTAGYGLAKEAIEDEVGQEVFIEYMHFRPLNNLHAGWKWITENWGYNHDDNRLESPSYLMGRNVYLKKMVAVTQAAVGQGPEPSSQGNYGISPGAGFTMFRPMLDALNALDAEDLARIELLKTLHYKQEVRIGEDELESVEIHWVTEHDDGSEWTGFHVVDLSSYDTDQEYYQAKYTYTTEEEEIITAYWIYDIHTGAHPELDRVFTNPATIEPGTYFPFVAFVNSSGNRGSDAVVGTPQFETTKKLMNFLGLDFKQMADEIYSGEDSEDIEQAAMIMAVPINSQDQVDIEYLCRYFENLADNLPLDVVAHDQIKELTTQNGGPDICYKVNVTDLDLDMTISFDMITVKLYAGQADEEHGKEFANLEIEEAIELLGNPLEGAAPLKSRVLRRQLSPQVYQEIVVRNPMVRYTIYKNLGAEGGFDDERCLIPLDRDISKKMPVLKQQKLYYRSLYLVFNSHVVVKQKWWQSGAFKAILVVVAIVITVYSLGTTWQAAVAAAGVGATTSAIVAVFIQMILINILQGLAISVALSYVVEVIGAEWGFYLAMVAAMVGGYKAYQAGNLVSGSTASNLLTASAGLSDASAKKYAADMGELYQEQAEFNLLQDQKWDELAQLRKALDPGIHVDPFEFIGREPMLIMGESPTSYINRSIHAGNVGVSGPNIIQNFVEFSLRLPSTEETLGDVFR